MRCNETEVLKKLVSLNYLENITLDITSDFKNINKIITRKNRIASKLNINWKISSDCILYDILNIFPYLTELSLDLSDNKQSNNGSMK